MRRGNSSEVYLRKPWNTNRYSACGGSLATSTWYISALNGHGQSWTSFLVFAWRIFIRGNFLHGDWVFPVKSGVVGRHDMPGKASLLPRIKGLSPRAFYPPH